MTRSLIGWKPFSRDVNVASARIRCLNPLSALQAGQYPVELFDPAHAERYAAVVYSKSYDDASQREASALRESGVRVVFDLCDNHFYNPGRLPGWERAGQNLRRMMAIAHELVASTDTLAEVITHELGEPRAITVIGDAVETDLRGPRGSLWSRFIHTWRWRELRRALDRDRREGRTRLVWFGHHGSPYAEGGLLDLQKLRDLAETLDVEHPLSLTVISNSRSKYREAIQPWRIPTRYFEWHPATFLPALRAHSISVIPINPNPFTRCKSNNRLALSLSMGLPVVADAIPSYEPFRETCVLDRWEEGLTRYTLDADARRRDVAGGQTLVERISSLGRIAGEWVALFDRLRSR